MGGIQRFPNPRYLWSAIYPYNKNWQLHAIHHIVSVNFCVFVGWRALCAMGYESTDRTNYHNPINEYSTKVHKYM